MTFRALTVAAVVLGWVLPAGAQQSVRLEFNDGKVTLSARNAPIRAILAEWARLGGATIVNGDRVAGQPVSLELAGVPERQALDIVLRGVSGYMIAPRRAGSSGPSLFNRILILPTSAAPSAPPPAVAGRPGPQRPTAVVRPPQPEEAPSDAMQDDADQPDEQEPPTFTQPPRAGVPGARPPIQTRPTTQVPDEPVQEEQPNDDVPMVKPTPLNPFGIPAGSSSTPGIVTPLPQGQQRPAPARVQ
jgi:hypothetical protein